jgi:hypothetical protein
MLKVDYSPQPEVDVMVTNLQAQHFQHRCFMRTSDSTVWSLEYDQDKPCELLVKERILQLGGRPGRTHNPALFDELVADLNSQSQQWPEKTAESTKICITNRLMKAEFKRCCDSELSRRSWVKLVETWWLACFNYHFSFENEIWCIKPTNSVLEIQVDPVLKEVRLPLCSTAWLPVKGVATFKQLQELYAAIQRFSFKAIIRNVSAWLVLLGAAAGMALMAAILFLAIWTDVVAPLRSNTIRY